MIAISVTLLAISNIAMAYYHSLLMKRGKQIKHGLWSLYYLLFAALLSILNHSCLLFIDSLLIRKVVFDISLNLFNKRSPFFVSTETTSIIDEFHYKLFGQRLAWVYYVAYAVGAVVVTVGM